jgi:hypothetical protein
MARRKHLRQEPVVVDKHLDADALGSALGRRGRSAAQYKPTRPYRGQYAKDEDFADVLQLAWEEETALLTADAKMIDKALRFERQLPKAEACLRGLIILPPGKDEQISALRRFVAGEIVAMASQKGDAVPKSLDEIEDFNVAIDLRTDTPRVVHLCDCD